jgi:tetratricopeptide (TPR) repeat protein
MRPPSLRLDALKRTELLGTLPALAAVAVFLALGASEAGFFPLGTSAHRGLGWYQGGLLLLLLLAVARLALGGPPRPHALMLVALTAFTAYTGWSFLSMIWAGDPGAAWDGANRTAMYLVTFALFALWPLGRRRGFLVVGAFAFGIVALGLIEVLRLGASEDPIAFFRGIRFAEPAGYINANVALWTLGLFPCLALAGTRSVPTAVRAPAFGGAGMLAGLALFGQSRGWALALPLALLLFLAISPARIRLLVTTGVVAVGTFLASGPILAVHDDFTPRRFDASVDDAVAAILVLAGVLTVIGLVVALIDRRVSGLGWRVPRVAPVGATVAAVLCVAVTALAFTAVDAPARISDAWSDFKRGAAQPEEGASRFQASGNNRYDFWRVAWDLFEGRPVKGIGAENFQLDYLSRARSYEKPRYAHSLELGTLSQTGVVGALLLFGALLTASVAALRAVFGAPRDTAAVVAAATATFLYWLLHASVDWLWEFPGLTAPALALLALAGSWGSRPSPRTARRLPAPARLGGLAVCCLGGLALAASLLAPWWSQREVERALTGWRTNTALAFQRLDRAAELNPLASRPHLAAGSIAVTIDDDGRARAAFREALEREPRDPFALLELGALASEAGDRGGALSLLERALRQNRRDGITRASLQRVRDGGVLDIRDVNAQLLRQVRSRAD